MSVVCAVTKNGEISIACDSQTNFGSIKASARHMKNSHKILRVNDNFMGIVGWNAVANIMEHLIIIYQSRENPK